MNKRIAGYLRISVDTERDKDSTSIENQRKIIKEHVAEYFPDYEIDFFEDRDKSGYTFEQRDGYQKMRPKLLNGYYSILIVKDFSRFSRRNSKGLGELEDLKDAGVRIISVSDNIDFPTFDEWQNIQIRFLFNEMPVTDASKKVKRVIDSRQKSGKWICAVPYGYYITNPKTMTYCVDEKAVPVIQKIFDLYLDGWGYKKIANYLTAEKIPTPRTSEKQRRDEERAIKGEEPTKIKASKAWAVPTVKEILSNDFYIGTLRQRKYTRTRINGIDKKLGCEQHRVFENHHQAIIDVRKFAKAQEQMKFRTRSNYRGQKKYDNSYSGFLFCGECGSPMFSMSRKDLAPAYTCGSYHRHGTDKNNGGCTSHHTRVDLLDIMIKKYIERVMHNSKQMIAELEKGIKNEPGIIKADASSLEAAEIELAKAKEELKNATIYRNRDLDRAAKRFSASALEKETDRIYERYDAIEDELRERIDGLENQVKFLAEKRNSTIQINRIAKTAIDIFHEILLKDKLDKRDLALIVDRITVYEDNNIEIQLKADISMLLETGTVSEELLKESSFVGTAVNFNWDTESILNATVVQKALNRKDKAFSVNVVHEGDPLEIYTAADGEVIFKKYSPIGELSEFAGQYTDVLNRATNLPVIITDRDHVIAASGIGRKEAMDKRISAALEEMIEDRGSYTAAPDKKALFPLADSTMEAGIAFPIIGGGDVAGAVVLMLNPNGSMPTQTEIKLVSVAASFLGKQTEE